MTSCFMSSSPCSIMNLYKSDTILYRKMVFLNTLVAVRGSHGKKGFTRID